ncbi:MAG: phage virion morphogenesis protein [Oscillospiraceae bacterium]|nr:phage virion morphogenesis protein [Oscillospiraceae bacterium]
MMSFTITDNSDAVMRALREQCMEGLQEIGEEAVKQARKTVQSKHLVDTGDLRDSIRYSLGHDGVYVGTDNDHAAFHELGTGHYTVPHASEKYGVKPLHFIRNAARGHRKKYTAIMKKAMEGDGR